MRERVSDRDKAIGRQMGVIRRIRGVTQRELGNAIGVSSQQVQKYEMGINKISAGKLEQAAQTLQVPLMAFFRPEVTGISSDIDRRGQWLLGAYHAIESEDLRKLLLRSARVFAQESKA